MTRTLRRLATTALVLAAQPGCAAGAAEPGPPPWSEVKLTKAEEHYRSEALGLFRAALLDEACRKTFTELTGEDPRAVFSARRMWLVWETDVATAMLYPSTLGLTSMGSKPVVTIFLARLRLATPSFGASTLVHEMVHVSLMRNPHRVKITREQEEMAAGVVSRVCIPVDWVGHKQPEASK